eukprot:3280792-Pyramimonas_sp.AAC.1
MWSGPAFWHLMPSERACGGRLAPAMTPKRCRVGTGELSPHADGGVSLPPLGAASPERRPLFRSGVSSSCRARALPAAANLRSFSIRLHDHD